MTRLIRTAALVVSVTCLVALTSATHLVAATNTLIMSGLNNPRGLALGPDGGIYVAEAGAGGAGPSGSLHARSTIQASSDPVRGQGRQPQL